MSWTRGYFPRNSAIWLYNVSLTLLHSLPRRIVVARNHWSAISKLLRFLDGGRRVVVWKRATLSWAPIWWMRRLVPDTNSLLGQSLLCFLTSRNVLEVNRILFRTPVSLVQGNVLTKTSRSSISFTLRAMGSIQESNEMLVKSDVHLPWSYPEFNRDVTRIDHIHDHRIPDPYRL